MSIEQIGKFHVLGPLGSGAHSTILHVRREEDGKQYALKVVHNDGAEEVKFLEQARHEYQIAQMLDHPGLIKIYAMESQRDWLFRVRKIHLLIEYVNGKTIDNVPPMPLCRLVQVFARVAAALGHMHRRGVFHADLKPNNILVSRAGDVKVIDYGLGWIKGENKGRVQGTLEYMAPEQARKKIVNERSDVYNFGATMYRMLTSRHPPKIGEGIPLEGADWDHAIRPVKDACPRAPAELCAIVERCLIYDPHHRPGVDELKEVLTALVRALVRSPADRLEAMDW